VGAFAVWLRSLICRAGGAGSKDDMLGRFTAGLVRVVFVTGREGEPGVGVGAVSFRIAGRED
jgi:hypothetical protein